MDPVDGPISCLRAPLRIDLVFLPGFLANYFIQLFQMECLVKAVAGRYTTPYNSIIIVLNEMRQRATTLPDRSRQLTSMVRPALKRLDESWESFRLR